MTGPGGLAGAAAALEAAGGLALKFSRAACGRALEAAKQAYLQVAGPVAVVMTWLRLRLWQRLWQQL